jgi:hypothetical protein
MHDDVRHIDWNVTARLQQPYVRQFTEDRDLSAWFLLDLSGSVDFGSAEVTKLAVAKASWRRWRALLTRHGNRVGAVLYHPASRCDTGAAARPGPRLHVLQLLQRMRTRPKAAQQGRRAAHRAGRPAEGGPTASCGAVRWSSWSVRLHQRPGWEQALARLARRHEVVAVRLFDPLRWNCPTSAWPRWKTPKPASSCSSTPRTRPSANAYAAIAAAARRSAAAGPAAVAGVDTLELATDEDLLDALLRFADLRRQRAGSRYHRRFPAHFKHAGCSLIEEDTAMSFSGPVWLWTLLALPLLVLLYLWLLASGARSTACGWPAWQVARPLGKGPGWRRHVPPLLLLLALAALLLATARPTAKITLPLSRAHHHPGHGRLGQHACRGRQAQPPGGQRRRRPRPSCRAAARGAGGRGQPLPAPPRWCRRPPPATKTWWPRSTASSCSAPPPPAAASSCRWPRCSPTTGIEIQITGQRNFPSTRGRAKDQPQVHAGGARQLHVGGGHHAHRRPAHHRPRPDGRRQDGRRARRARLHRGHRHQGGETIGFEGWSMRVRLDEETLKNISTATAPTISTPARPKT